MRRFLGLNITEPEVQSFFTTQHRSKEVNVFVLSNYVFQTNSGEKSVLVRQRLDCNRGRYKILAFKSFSKTNAKGNMIISNGVSKGWLYIVPRTPDAILQKIVCSG